MYSMFDSFKKISIALLATFSFGVMNCTYSEANNQREMDESIFKAHYQQAAAKLTTMSGKEKITQLFLVRTPPRKAEKILKKYQLGGYILYKQDVDGETKQSLKKKIAGWKVVSKIMPLVAVDEEGGTVTRISSDSNFRRAPFPSPQELYVQGGLKAIEGCTKEMVQLFEELGVNVNLAPVADISTNPEDFMHKRSFGRDAKTTSAFVETVIRNSKDSKVSFTLKHFPGYGNNKDTHKEQVGDNRSLDFIRGRDILPFKAGVEAGAEAILVSHNIVKAIDPQRPASLSKKVVDFARNECGFTGIIMTDSLDMGAITDFMKTGAPVEAFLAGNDVIMITDYRKALKEMRRALIQGKITEEEIDKRVFKILAWKYYKGIIN